MKEEKAGSRRMRYRARAIAAMTLGLLFGAMTGVGLAATSGVVYKTTLSGQNYGSAALCVESQVNPSGGTVYNAGITRSRTTSSCATAKSLNAGYLGVDVGGYRDGAFCGRSTTLFTSSSGSAITRSSAMCTNPAGTQVFRTLMQGHIYSTTAGEYHVYSHNSPNANA